MTLISKNYLLSALEALNTVNRQPFIKFEKIKRAKKAASLAKPDVPLIDMGVGEPDEMAFPVVVEALQKAAAQAENRGYADNGGDSLSKRLLATCKRSSGGIRRLGNGGDSLYWLQERAFDFTRLFYQSWRLCFNDGAGLSCARNARELFRRLGLQYAADC